MGYSFGDRSKQRMTGVHPDLVRVMELAIKLTQVDFTVLEGLRTQSRQASLVASGASTTMNSRHLTGHAIDIAPFIDGEVRWDWPLYYKLAAAVKAAAAQLNIAIVWGGDWKTFKDGPHFELSRKFYQ